MSANLEFRDVYRHFGDKRVLQGLSFTVQPGEVFALLGRNGTGKTTAIRILLGFLRPMSGESFVLGVNSGSLTPEDRGRIAYVSEGHRLYTSMRVASLLAFEAGTRPRFDREWAKRAVEQCGLGRRQHVGLLSRGQRAQLALIIAIACRPEVLIFDDPAMGLDTVMRREFLDTTIELLSNRGISVLFSSHILTDVERIADRIGILQEGRLLVDAPLEELKTRVQKRHWTCAGEEDGDPRQVPDVPGLLRARSHRDGYELTLLDFDDNREAVLRSPGVQLSDPLVPTLEDLFLDLTTDEQQGLLPNLTEQIR